MGDIHVAIVIVAVSLDARTLYYRLQLFPTCSSRGYLKLHVGEVTLRDTLASAPTAPSVPPSRSPLIVIHQMHPQNRALQAQSATSNHACIQVSTKSILWLVLGRVVPPLPKSRRNSGPTLVPGRAALSCNPRQVASANNNLSAPPQVRRLVPL